VELALVDIIEKRIDDGAGSWRRKGISIADRSLGALRQSLVLRKPNDYRIFIPFKKEEPFTVRNLALAAGISASIARKTVYVLFKIGIIEKAGKQGNALVYTMAYKRKQSSRRPPIV
jgi:hypothetical protein